jgi:RimJ/RimL family protein N-acetyltransferase
MPAGGEQMPADGEHVPGEGRLMQNGVYTLSIHALESERLLLEPLRPQDADELTPVFEDPLLHRFIAPPGEPPPNLGELRARFERQTAGSPDDSEHWLNWVVRERSSGAAVGTLQVTLRNPKQAVAELAWVIGTAYQGRGYAKEAAKLVADWLQNRGVVSLCAHIHPMNVASAHVARSLGLQPTAAMVDGECRWESEGAG